MATKKKAKSMKKVYVLRENGEHFEITAEDGKYYICGDIKFRKNAKRGDVIFEEETEGEG